MKKVRRYIGELTFNNYHIDSTEVSSLGLGSRPERSTSSSKDHHSKLHAQREQVSQSIYIHRQQTWNGRLNF
jgi:hypothetical protein